MNIKPGDRSRAINYRLNRVVQVVAEVRKFETCDVEVETLCWVCTETGEVLAIPHQSSTDIHAARIAAGLAVALVLILIAGCSGAPVVVPGPPVASSVLLGAKIEVSTIRLGREQVEAVCVASALPPSVGCELGDK